MATWRQGLLISIVCFTVAGFGQTAGQPAIYNNNGTAVEDPKPTVIDAAVYDQSHSDFCVRVYNAWSYVMNLKDQNNNPIISSVTVDARGLPGPQTCSDANIQTPFPANAMGRLLLGNSNITTSHMWIVPNGVELVGIGALSTTITAVAGFTDIAVLRFGTSSPNFINGYFGIKIRALTVDCHDNAGCTAIMNHNAEEASLVEDVGINNAATGLDLLIGTQKADNSGPYRNITFQYTTCPNSCGSAVGVKLVGNDGGQIIRGLDNMTYSGCNSPAAGGVAIQIIGAATRVSNTTINCASKGVQIGDSSVSTHNVEVEDVFVGNATTPIMVSSNSSNIYISNVTSNVSSTSTLLNDNGVAKAGTTTTVNLPGPKLGFYIRGECCTSLNSALVDSALATSAPKMVNGSTNLPWISPLGVCPNSPTGNCTP